MFDKYLGRNCRKIRKEKNISIFKMSKMLGIKEDIIKKYENGVLRIPTEVLLFYAKLKK